MFPKLIKLFFLVALPLVILAPWIFRNRKQPQGRDSGSGAEGLLMTSGYSGHDAGAGCDAGHSGGDCGSH